MKINGLFILVISMILMFPSWGNDKVRESEIAGAAKQLSEGAAMARRKAARTLAELGAPAAAELKKAADNDDYMVRATAIKALADIDAAGNQKLFLTKTGDLSDVVRLQAVKALACIKPLTKELDAVFRKMRTDSSQMVRDEANNALWPFHRDNIGIRNRVDYDYEVTMIKEIPLPLKGWKFKTDLEQEGHLSNYHRADFDDSKWSDIPIGINWEACGFEDYDGVAWYRLTFELPPKPEYLAIELHFGGVDEDAWVWLNDVYIGQHVLGPAGWDKPFNLDITKEVKWGQKNQITVRVYDSAMAGGIWKPVTVQLFN